MSLPSPARVAKVLRGVRKAKRSKCGRSSVPSNESASLRACAAVTAISARAQGDEMRVEEFVVGAAVGERGLAVEQRDAPARCGENRVACGRVPLAGGSMARVDIGFAGRDQAEFDGRAGGDEVRDLVVREQ